MCPLRRAHDRCAASDGRSVGVAPGTDPLLPPLQEMAMPSVMLLPLLVIVAAGVYYIYNEVMQFMSKSHVRNKVVVITDAVSGVGTGKSDLMFCFTSDVVMVRFTGGASVPRDDCLRGIRVVCVHDEEGRQKPILVLVVYKHQKHGSTWFHMVPHGSNYSEQQKTQFIAKLLYIWYQMVIWFTNGNITASFRVVGLVLG